LSFFVLILDPETYPSLAWTSSRPSFPRPLPVESNRWRWVPPYLDASVSRSRAAVFETVWKIGLNLKLSWQTENLISNLSLYF